MACKDCKWFGNTMLFAAFGFRAKPAGLCHFNPPTGKGFPIVSELSSCSKFEAK